MEAAEADMTAFVGDTALEHLVDAKEDRSVYLHNLEGYMVAQVERPVAGELVDPVDSLLLVSWLLVIGNPFVIVGIPEQKTLPWR